MKLVIAMKLSDRNLMYHIFPLSKLENIDKIIIIRDTEGPNIKKVEYISPPMWMLKCPPFAFFFKMIKLINCLLKENPLMVHSYLLFPHGILALIAAKLTGRKAGIHLIAGPVELYTLGSSPEKKYSYTDTLPPINSIGKILLKLVNLFDIIIVAGSFTKNFLLDKGISIQKIFYIPYTIIDENCHPLTIPKIYDLIYLGRLAKVKHIEVSIYVVKKLVDDYGLEKIKFCIVGDGPCRKRLEDLTDKLNLRENIKFLGYQSDIATYFAKSKLSIITSERETGPLTAIESMMCGVPVISSRCGDTVNDLIRDGIDGYLINNYEDYDEYAKRIAYLLFNDTIRLSFSENAKDSPNIFNADETVTFWNLVINEATSYKIRKYESA